MPGFSRFSGIATLSDSTRIDGVEGLIDYKFTDPSLLREALRAAGYVDRDGNKKLAVIGDAALKLVFAMEGHARRESREKTNTIVSTVATNAYLANEGFLEGLERYIYINPSQGGLVSNGLKATTMEAILGAVLLDSRENFSVLKEVVGTMGLSWPE